MKLTSGNEGKCFYNCSVLKSPAGEEVFGTSTLDVVLIPEKSIANVSLRNLFLNDVVEP